MNCQSQKERFTLNLPKIKSMTTVQLNISDDIIKAYGLQAVQQRLMDFLEWEELSIAAKNIQAAITEAGLDNDQLCEQARQLAWDEFKQTHLKGIIQ